MPNFDPASPRTPRQYAGVDIKAPTVFTEGHTLNPNEAKWANTMLQGAVGNAYAGKVRRALGDINAARAEAFAKDKKNYTGTLTEDGKSPAPATLADLSWDHQAEYETMFSGYEIGVSNRGVGEPTDPVEAAARAIAVAKVRAIFKAKGFKETEFRKAPAKDTANYPNRWAEAVATFRAKNPWVEDLAKQQVEALASAGSEGSDDMDF